MKKFALPRINLVWIASTVVAVLLILWVLMFVYRSLKPVERFAEAKKAEEKEKAGAVLEAGKEAPKKAEGVEDGEKKKAS